MVFSSVIFIFVFFPLCTGGYYLLKAAQGKIKFLSEIRLSDWFLLLACIGFYSWAGKENAVGICLYIIFVYFLGKMDSKVSGHKKE